MSENPNPIQEAQKARKRIHNAVETNTPAKLEIPPQIAACILGLPRNIFEKYGFSALIKSGPQGITFLVADNQQIALEAFRQWQQNKNPKIANQFNKAQYLALYRLLSAIKINQADKAIKGAAGFFLRLLEENDERLQGLSELIAKNRSLTDEDLRILHLYLTQIWGNLPKNIQNTIASFSPENVFNIS